MSRNLLVFLVSGFAVLFCISPSAKSSLYSATRLSTAVPTTILTFGVSTTSLPAATASVGYRTRVAASGGTTPYVWTVIAGSLPAGLILDPAQGVITGIPVSPGTDSFEIQAQDSAGQTAMRSLSLTVQAAIWATTYYIDSAGGKDSNYGTSQSAPWKTIARVNVAKFAPGDRILFKSGDVWREQLDFPSSGVAGDPIQIGSYGSGTAPIISGADLVPSNLWKQCTGCSATIWEASVKTQPHVVLFNGAKGKKQSSISQLSSAME